MDWTDGERISEELALVWSTGADTDFTSLGISDLRGLAEERLWVELLIQLEKASDPRWEMPTTLVKFAADMQAAQDRIQELTRKIQVLQVGLFGQFMIEAQKMTREDLTGDE